MPQGYPQSAPSQQQPPQQQQSQRSERLPLSPEPLEAEQMPRIDMWQLVSTDANTGMFKCPLCNGVARHPKVTMCCQKVFCGPCLDPWLQNSTVTPCCNTFMATPDGSTGGIGC